MGGTDDALTDNVRIALIVAVARNGVIGKDGDLPWRLSSDLKLFRRLTMGHPIIMGRRTWASLKKKPLDGRDNIVVTRDPNFEADGAQVVQSVTEALKAARAAARARGVNEIMVIGGAEIYRATLAAADRLYWTEVEAEPDGDTTFPPIEPRDWVQVGEGRIAQGPNDAFGARLLIFDRVRPD